MLQLIWKILGIYVLKFWFGFEGFEWFVVFSWVFCLTLMQLFFYRIIFKGTLIGKYGDLRGKKNTAFPMCQDYELQPKEAASSKNCFSPKGLKVKPGSRELPGERTSKKKVRQGLHWAEAQWPGIHPLLLTLLPHYLTHYQSGYLTITGKNELTSTAADEFVTYKLSNSCKKKE